MGERAVGFLRKFYGWYLRGTPGAKAIRRVLVTCPAVADAERALLEFCPEAESLVAAHEAEIALLGDIDADRLLELPISIYGGG
jgi:hypothetical protein